MHYQHTKQYLYNKSNEDMFPAWCDVSPYEWSFFYLFPGGAGEAKTYELCDLAVCEEETFLLSLRCCFTLRTPPSSEVHRIRHTDSTLAHTPFYNLSQLLFFWLLFPFCEQRSLCLFLCNDESCQNAPWYDSVCDVTAVMCVVAVRAALASTAVYVCVGWARRMLPLPAFCANVHW